MRLILVFVLIIFSSFSTAFGKSSIKIITNSPLVYTSPNNNCNTGICNELISLINNSKHTIDFAIYGLRGQDEILNALINAKNRGIKIRGVIFFIIYTNSRS